ncbi:uncharacterized protein LOC119283593 [Triticum dicoccoides]|uniref:uncharacterized protein LOC119283593 n=1 Tax=Triticum dicoccoides TaxID=85692 RepID=UPI00188E996A|nr:uncharacterized protein LOC119283593 [Triticum dicoccoides]
MVRATGIDGKGGAHWGRDGEEAGDREEAGDGAGEAGDAVQGDGEGAGDGTCSDEEEAGDGAMLGLTPEGHKQVAGPRTRPIYKETKRSTTSDVAQDEWGRKRHGSRGEASSVWRPESTKGYFRLGFVSVSPPFHTRLPLAAQATRNPSRRRMRNPTPYASLLNDAPPADLDGADADLDLCPDGGLCWPDDPLDTVIGCVSMLDDGFLEGLGLGCSPPRGRVGDGQDSGGALAGMKADADLGSLAEGRPLSLCDTGAPGGRKRSAFHVFDSKPEGLSPARARSLSCSTTTTSSSTASGARSLSPTPGGTEAPREPASKDDDLRWTLPRKPHHRRGVRRRAASWSLALPPQLMSAGAYDCNGDSNANDDKDKDYVLSHCKKGRRNGGPRPARRQQKKTEDKICTHCRVEDTPQWRTGPAGSGTLCNACGIRYKMGKLFPEYRPSTSPEFSSLEHSNRHRNVERIREKKKKMKVMAPEVPGMLQADTTRTILRA